MSRIGKCLLSFFILIQVFLSAQVFAQSEEEKSFLSLYFKEDELRIISATRSLKSITRVAENVEVVTASDIELMNAHTLADVLNTINGVVAYVSGASPGSIAATSIQGSSINHVVVFLDGVSMNLIVSDVADVSNIPVQMMDRVEIIKGPGSSVWGSSLGGVINIITKSPRNSEKPGGMLSASYGERNTGDFRGEVSGTKSGFGYYLSAGRLQTNGLRAFEHLSTNNLYAKFTYEVSDRTNLLFTLFYQKGAREEGDLSAFDELDNDRTETLLGTLNLSSSLATGLNLDLSLRAARLRWDRDDLTLSTGEIFPERNDDRKFGATAKLTWKTGIHTIVAGSDYDYKKEITDLSPGADLNVFALYANDTISIGKLTVIPGIRYDHTDRNEDFTSPSLGATWEVADKTLLRGYVGRGFQLPTLSSISTDGTFYRHNADLQPEKVWSYQAGVESAFLQYLWAKVSVFRHNISDAIVREQLDATNDVWTDVNKEKVRRQGIEAEIRSKKFYNFTLSAAASFVRSKDMTTGETLHDQPDYTYDLSLKYDDEKSFRALLKGRYVWWHQTQEGFIGNYNAFIFDLNLIKTIFRRQSDSAEVFLTGHNIFNGSSYPDDVFKNARRWFEGGLRYKF
jgi:vitamin B12 transporter